MGAVPVGYVLRRRSVSCQQSDRSEGKECEEAVEGRAVEMETVVEEFKVGQKVDESNTLNKLARLCMLKC